MKCENFELIHDPTHVFIKLPTPARYAGCSSGTCLPLLTVNVYQEEERRREKRKEEKKRKNEEKNRDEKLKQAEKMKNEETETQNGVEKTEEVNEGGNLDILQGQITEEHRL